MAVNELNRDYLKLLHMCDTIENIQNGMKMEHEGDAEKKKLGRQKALKTNEKTFRLLFEPPSLPAFPPSSGAEGTITSFPALRHLISVCRAVTIVESNYLSMRQSRIL